MGASVANSGAHILFSDNGNGHSHKRTIRHWSQHATFLQIRLRQQL